MTDAYTVPTIPYAEQGGIIGSAWMSNAADLRALASSQLKPEDFEGPDRVLFSFIAGSKEKFNYLEIESRLTDSTRERLGAIQTVLQSGRPTRAEFMQWIATIKRKSATRQLRAKLIERIAELDKPTANPDTIGADAIKDVVSIRDDLTGSTLAPISDGVSQAKQTTAEWRKGNKYLDSVPSGFLSIDRITGGFRRKHVVALAARPGMGKTQLALQIARNVALRAKAENRDSAIVVFSAEMGHEELVMRMAQCASGISAEWLEEGEKPDGAKVTDQERDEFDRHLDMLSPLPIRVDEHANPTTSHMLYVVAGEMAQHKDGVELVIFDYLELAGDNAGKNGNETNRVGLIMRGLKRIAKVYNCPVMVLCQLSREVEKRSSREPELADLRQSGDIEALSNQVMFIYRPDYYRANGGSGYVTKEVAKRALDLESHGGNCVINIAKNRNRKARKGAVVNWDGTITRFYEAADKPTPNGKSAPQRQPVQAEIDLRT